MSTPPRQPDRPRRPTPTRPVTVQPVSQPAPIQPFATPVAAAPLTQGPKTPVIAVGVTMLASFVAVVATFLPWVIVDARQSAELAPDFVPNRLVNASSVYRASAHALVGLGTVLAFIVIVAGATVILGLRGHRRWPFVLASLTYVIAAFIASVSILVLRVAKTGYRFVLPDDWVGDSPVVTLGVAGLLFVVACITAAVFAARTAFSRPSPRARRAMRG